MSCIHPITARLVPQYEIISLHLGCCYCLFGKKVFEMFSPMSCIHPITARLVPQYEIISLHFTALLNCVKMFHLQYYLVAGVIHIQSQVSKVCVYTCSSQDRCWLGKDIKKIRTAANVAYQGNLPMCHLGHMP